MKKIKWILPLGLTAAVAAMTPTIASCACFKSYKVAIECSTTDLNGKTFSVKYHRTFSISGSWEKSGAISDWKVYIGDKQYTMSEQPKGIKIWTVSNSLNISIDGKLIDGNTKIYIQ